MGGRVRLLSGSSCFEGGEVLEMHWKSLSGHISMLEKAGPRQCALCLDLLVYGGPCFSEKPTRKSSRLHKRALPV